MDSRPILEEDRTPENVNGASNIVVDDEIHGSTTATTLLVADSAASSNHHDDNSYGSVHHGNSNIATSHPGHNNNGTGTSHTEETDLEEIPLRDRHHVEWPVFDRMDQTSSRNPRPSRGPRFYTSYLLPKVNNEGVILEEDGDDYEEGIRTWNDEEQERVATERVYNRDNGMFDANNPILIGGQGQQYRTEHADGEASVDVGPLAPAQRTMSATLFSYCCPIVDYSEPFLWLVLVFGVVGLIFALVKEHWISVALSASAIVMSVVSLWRIRKLGIAYFLMESVDRLTKENQRLGTSVSELQETNDSLSKRITELHDVERQLKEGNREMKRISVLQSDQLTKFKTENTKLMEAVGLVGENVTDLEVAKNQLFALLDDIKKENDRAQANNQVQLFLTVDRDKDERLNKSEIEQMRGYCELVYGKKLDLSQLDTDNDGLVSFKEFVSLFQ